MAGSPDRIVIISPALREANNGNWRTAQRWARFLRPRFPVAIARALAADTASAQCLIALHARRSADAIAQFAAEHEDRPRIVVLTGTDLYRDLADGSREAQRSLDLATHLVVLQTAALDALDARHRAKARVIFQSAPALAPGHPRRTTFDVIFVGHMRAEKDPLTPMRALQRLPASSRLRLVQVGDALEAKYAQAARELEAMSSRYQWLRALPHAATRQRIRHSRALLISSVMEGGANVVVEAVTCGVPVIASRISGNIGMLGKDYEAYFTAGDDRELARLLERISVDSAFLARLRMQCAARAPLFEPARERSEVDRLVDDALRAATRPSTAESTACAARS